MDEKSTLDLVLRQSGGALRVPLKCAASILGLEPQTIRNRLALGTWPLHRHVEGRRIFFDARDLAAMVDGVDLDEASGKGFGARRRGRPHKSPRVRG